MTPVEIPDIVAVSVLKKEYSMTRFSKKLIPLGLVVLGTNLIVLVPLWCLYYGWKFPFVSSLLLILSVEVPPILGLSLLFFIWKNIEIREAPKEA